jgi:hypothetical protein
MVVRDATVGPESGTSAVSGSTTSIASIGRPSRSATICPNTVIVPWPDVGRGREHAHVAVLGDLDRRARGQLDLARAREARAVEERRHPEPAQDAPGCALCSRAPPCAPASRPRRAPRRAGRTSPGSCSELCPVGSVSPLRRKFFRRSSSGSMPRARADLLHVHLDGERSSAARRSRGTRRRAASWSAPARLEIATSSQR